MIKYDKIKQLLSSGNADDFSEIIGGEDDLPF